MPPNVDDYDEVEVTICDDCGQEIPMDEAIDYEGAVLCCVCLRDAIDED